MNTQYELDPALLVAEINQTDSIASVQATLDPDVRSFKLRSTDVKSMALEIKDFLGRSEYNAIKIYKVFVTPDSIAEPGDTYISFDQSIRHYEPGQHIKGHTLIRAMLFSKD